MATPSLSSIVNFVKMYPITLCGFSLLFMPSVHRLLLYFTPLLLSTAIFIVAMLSWGPESSNQKGHRRGKRHEWALNGSLKIYGDEDDDEEEDDEEEEVAEVSEARGEKCKASTKLEAQMLEPDPDFDEESKRVGTASIGAIFRGQAEPHADLGSDGVETVSNGAIAARDLQGDCMGTASEPDPDLHGEHPVDQAAGKNQLHAAPDHHHSHDHAEPAPISHDEQAAGDHHDGAESDHLDYHDAASDQANHDDNYGDLEANQGDDYHDAEPDPDLQGSDGKAAHAKTEGAGAPRVENDDVRAAIAELKQKLGLVQRAPCSEVDACEHRHPQQSIGKGLQTLQAAA